MSVKTYEDLCLSLGRLLDYEPYHAPTPSEFIKQTLYSKPEKNIELFIHGANIMAEYLENTEEESERKLWGKIKW